MKINTLTPASVDFPDPLKNIPSPPKKIYTLGTIGRPKSPVIGIVGTRRPTRYGRYVTEMMSFELAKLGITIISGLALGIDSIAHKGALDAKGHTVAVMPCGLDQIYPATHRQLAKDILKSGGGLLSEYKEGTPAHKSNFVERNRLVAGLAETLIVTEAASRSGTSITAGFALDQGKTVLAVPGNINSPMSEGTNNLIKTGAYPVTSVKDVLDICNLVIKDLNTPRPRGENQEEQAILDLLIEGPMEGSELQRKSGLATDKFNQTITMLEINAQIRNLGSNTWSL
jgi:DNA processing protein